MQNSTSTTRAVVLGGGGTAGIAWESGLLAGLLDSGVDLGAADLVVGTSAGSVVAVQLRANALTTHFPRTESPQASADAQGPVSSPAAPPFDAEKFVQLMGTAAESATGPQDARARLGARATASTAVMTEEAWLARIGHTLPRDWPTGELALTAVDSADGAFTVFNARSSVLLEKAVAASCTVPTVFPLVHIDGHAYMDGGMRSATNADLAAGHDKVLVISCNPEPRTSPFGPTLDELLLLIEETGDAFHITADGASRAAFGRNPLDPARRIPSFEAGLAQAEQLADSVKEFWSA